MGRVIHTNITNNNINIYLIGYSGWVGDGWDILKSVPIPESDCLNV